MILIWRNMTKFPPSENILLSNQMNNLTKYQINWFPISIAVIVIMAISITNFTSCAPEFIDTSIDRKWLDSLEKREKTFLSIELDSLCELKKEKFIKNAVDSIMGERLEEMRKFNQ